ncbi:hypothetical protein V1506DRAFT_580651 [Lipomyces tetrasporus]
MAACGAASYLQATFPKLAELLEVSPTLSQDSALLVKIPPRAALQDLQWHAPAAPASRPKVSSCRVDYSGDDDAALDDAALVEGLQVQHVLIITMCLVAPSDTISKLGRAAAKADVPYVLPNWFCHDAANNRLCNDSLLSHNRDSICEEIESLGISSYLLLICNFCTWPECGRDIANLLDLKELPDDETDETDRSPTLSQFRNGSIYISSFRLSQRHMFESVKRVTGTTEAYWTISHESAEQRWKDGQPHVLPNGDGDCQSSRGLHNDLLGLTVEDLDKFTAIGVRLGENGEVSRSH